MAKHILIFLFLFKTLIAKSQNITGLWTGELAHMACTDFSDLFQVDLTITSDSKNNYTALIKFYSAITDKTDPLSLPIFQFKKEARFTDNQFRLDYKAADETFSRMFNYSYFLHGRYSIKLMYSKTPNFELLKGTYTASNGAKGTISLSRPLQNNLIVDSATKPIKNIINNKNNDSIATAVKPNTNALNTLNALRNKMFSANKTASSSPPISKKIIDTPVTPTPAEKLISYARNKTTELNNRKTDIVEQIVLEDTAKIVLKLFDNAEVDGDTVSIFFDNELVLDKIPLKEKATEFVFYKHPKKDKIIVKMFADNLGSIPPNTALLIVETNNKRQEIFMSSSLIKNSSVEFIWKLKDNKK